MSLAMLLKNVPYRRLASSASAPSTLTMSVPPPTTPAIATTTSSTLGTLTLAVTALLPLLVYSVMSWRWHTSTQSGTMLTLVMKDLMFSCMVATL